MSHDPAPEQGTHATPTETPRQARVAIRTLELLQEITDASGGAVFEVRDRERRTLLLYAAGVGQLAISRVQTEVRFGAAIATQTIDRDGYSVLYARVTRDFGLVFYLEAPTRTDSADPLLRGVAKDIAIHLGAEAPPPVLASHVTSSFAERRLALLDLCRHEEWNLARVARRIGVSRVTIYRMLRDHDIDRPGGKRPAFGRGRPA